MTVASYRQVLKLAQELPFNSQLELAEALLGNVRLTLASTAKTGFETDVSPLQGMTESELRALADAVVSPERQKRVKTLLDSQRARALSPGEQADLDALMDEIDQVALLKARALYTLQFASGEVRGN